MLPENCKFSLFRWLFSIIIVVTQAEKRSCPFLWNSEVAWVRNEPYQALGRNRCPQTAWALCAKANAVTAHSIKEPRVVLLRNCVEVCDTSSICFTLNAAPSDISLLLRCFESFGPQHLFIAGSPNINEQRLCFTSPIQPTPSGSTS